MLYRVLLFFQFFSCTLSLCLLWVVLGGIVSIVVLSCLVAMLSSSVAIFVSFFVQLERYVV